MFPGWICTVQILHSISEQQSFRPISEKVGICLFNAAWRCKSTNHIVRRLAYWIMKTTTSFNFCDFGVRRTLVWCRPSIWMLTRPRQYVPDLWHLIRYGEQYEAYSRWHELVLHEIGCYCSKTLLTLDSTKARVTTTLRTTVRYKLGRLTIHRNLTIYISFFTKANNWLQCRSC